MEILKWSMLSMFTLFIGAVAGFGFSTRKVVVAWYHIVGIVIFTYMVSLASSFIGHLVGEYISYRFLEVTISLGMIVIGILLFISKPIYPGNKELILFTLFIQLDVFLLNYHYALLNEGGYGLAFTISLLLLGSIVLGIVAGARKWLNWRVQMLIPYTSAVLVVLVGVVKML